jgi:putative ABC transport system permease protein
METRLVHAALWRRRATVALAITAVGLAATMWTALLVVSREIGYKAAHELRALGPNLVVVGAAPAEPSGDGPASGAPATAFPGFSSGVFAARSADLVDERLLRSRLAAAGVPGTPLLIATASVNGRPATLVGVDLVAMRTLHPTWKTPASDSWMGARLARRLGVQPGAIARVEVLGQAPHRLVVGSRLDAGGAADEVWWLPIPVVQRLAATPGRASLAHARVSGGRAADRAIATIESGGELEAMPLRAVSGTEAGLLDRTRRLMGLVTVAVLGAAVLCAFGTLTDLALERRKEVALLKALGATRRDLMRLFVSESVAVGLIGGVAGWLAGIGLAQLIGHQVFRSGVAVRWESVPIVVALSVAVAIVAAIGPLRLALAVDPAPALKGE